MLRRKLVQDSSTGDLPQNRSSIVTCRSDDVRVRRRTFDLAHPAGMPSQIPDRPPLIRFDDLNVSIHPAGEQKRAVG